MFKMILNYYCVANVSTRNLVIYSLDVFSIEFLIYSICVFLFSMIYLILTKLVELKYFTFSTSGTYWNIIWGIILFVIPMLIAILLVRYFMISLDSLKDLLAVLIESLGPLLLGILALALLSLMGLGMILGILWDLLKNFLKSLFGDLGLKILFALLMSLFGLLSFALLMALLSWAKIASMGGFAKLKFKSELERRKELKEKEKEKEALRKKQAGTKDEDENDEEDDQGGI